MGLITSQNGELDWGLSSYVPQSTSGPPAVFINKVLLEHTQPCSYMLSMAISHCSSKAKKVQQRWPAKLKIFTI